MSKKNTIAAKSDTIQPAAPADTKPEKPTSVKEGAIKEAAKKTDTPPESVSENLCKLVAEASTDFSDSSKTLEDAVAKVCAGCGVEEPYPLPYVMFQPDGSARWGDNFYKQVVDVAYSGLNQDGLISLEASALKRAVETLAMTPIDIAILLADTDKGHPIICLFYRFKDDFSADDWRHVLYGHSIPGGLSSSYYSLTKFIPDLNKFATEYDYFTRMLNIAATLRDFGMELSEAIPPEPRYIATSKIILLNLFRVDDGMRLNCDKDSFTDLCELSERLRIKRCLVQLNLHVFKPFNIGQLSFCTKSFDAKFFNEDCTMELSFELGDYNQNNFTDVVNGIFTVISKEESTKDNIGAIVKEILEEHHLDELSFGAKLI